MVLEANNRKLLENHANGCVLKLAGWLNSVAVTVAAGRLIWSWIAQARSFRGDGFGGLFRARALIAAHVHG
jgi:hypothetical protein